MRIELLIARRMGRSSDANSRRQGGVMVTIATTAVALSVAVMVVTLSIIFGFRAQIYDRFTTLSGDMIVAPVSGVNPSSVTPIIRGDHVEEIIGRIFSESGVVVKSITPYVSRAAVLRSAEGVEGVVLKGVDPNYDMSVMREGLVDGQLQEDGLALDGRSAVISSELSDQLKLSVGDRLELLIVGEEGDPRRDLYRISAIYNGGMGEMERVMVMVDITNVQSLNGWSSDQLSGYEVKIDWGASRGGKEVLEQLATAINSEIVTTDDDRFDGVAIYSTRQLYPSIFEWLSALDMNAVVVIIIMTIVAIFNIITVMLIMVLEGSSVIGVLKSMGMNNRSLAQIFAIRSVAITLRGLAIGNGVALLLLLIQRYFNVISLDEGSYILRSVPVDLSMGWLLLLNCGVVAVIALSIALPTRIVSRIEPSKAIKFQ
ncbi:MAG: ABC transporter permease [Rikenellaceae bacterium]